MSKKIIVLIIVIFFVIAAASGIFFALKNRQKDVQPQASQGKGLGGAEKTGLDTASRDADGSFCTEVVEFSGKKSENKMAYGACSKNKPAYCSQGVIVSNCSICGCDANETCSKNGECALKMEQFPMGAGGGGEGGGEGGAGEEGAGGPGGAGAGAGAGGGENQTSFCIDSDITNNPSPIYSSGSCQDNSGTYQDICTDSGGNPSVTWVKEYKCKSTAEGPVCFAEFKNCPSNSLNFFGDSNSECQSGECTVPPVSPTCLDGIQNQDETNVDCGGVCGGYWYNGVCNQNPEPTCNDNIQNQDETNVDCGGVCGGYWYNSQCNQDPAATCSDGIQNQGEEGIDCGGPCTACNPQGGGGQSETCYSDPIDEEGLTIFVNSVCHDPIGTYSNVCESPVGGGQSNIFVKTYVCVNNLCTAKYYSCPVVGEQYYGQQYVCDAGVCKA